MKKYTIFLDETLITELKRLHNTDNINISKILRKALQEYIDRLESDDSHIVLDGIRYPIPSRVP